MHWHRFTHFLLWFGVILPVIDMTVCQKITFNKMPVCPINSSLTQLSKMEGAQDIRTCFVACAANANCTVLHRTNGICYFGNQNQLTTLFNQSVVQSSNPCESHLREYGVRSKLVVFFDFRQGYSNLISPGTYDATPRGSVTRNAQGAHFPGTTSDFLEVDTQSASLVTSYLNSQNSFSFFVKAVRQAYYQQTYHYFSDCSGAFAGVFADRDSRAFVQHKFSTGGSSQTRQSISTPFSTGNTPQAVSVGAVFRNNSLNNFYLNGTDLATQNEMGWGVSGQPRCLRLGYSSDNNHALKGRMICYAIAMDALSTAELQQLDQICDWSSASPILIRSRI